MPGQFAMKQLLAMLINQRAIFRDEGNFVFQLGEKGNELVILIAAGDDKFDAAFLVPDTAP